MRRGPEGFRPSKVLGQNFLADPRLASRLVEALEPRRTDWVVEIGPGRGALTRLLAGRVGRVVAIERDRRLVEALRQQFEDDPTVTFVEADAREADLPSLCQGVDRVKLLGNLPYSVTSPLLIHFLDQGGFLERMVITVQREVAVRILARSGKEYGRLSVRVALGAETRRLFDLPPGAFRPRPRVVSTALLLRPASGVPEGAMPGLERVVKAAFGTRRKQIARSLGHGLARSREEILAALDEAGIDPRVRAEDVSPEAYLALASALEEPGPRSGRDPAVQCP